MNLSNTGDITVCVAAGQVGVIVNQSSMSAYSLEGFALWHQVQSMGRKLAPTELVHKFGKVMPCLFHFIASTPEDQEICEQGQPLRWLLEITP